MKTSELLRQLHWILVHSYASTWNLWTEKLNSASDTDLSHHSWLSQRKEMVHQSSNYLGLVMIPNSVWTGNLQPWMECKQDYTKGACLVWYGGGDWGYYIPKHWLWGTKLTSPLMWDSDGRYVYRSYLRGKWFWWKGETLAISINHSM